MLNSEIVAIVGPTGSGKTGVALRLAQQFNAEIISADSRQVYRHLSVGTAKPVGSWVHPRQGPEVYLVEGIPHYGLDIWDPEQPFTAADFLALADERIRNILQRGKRPLLVGGTGFYLKALAEGLAPLPPRDEGIRQRLRAEAETHGRQKLHERLAQVDPAAAQKIPANNWHRVIRALEVFELTRVPLSVWHARHQTLKKTRPIRMFALAPAPEAYEERLAVRCQAMLAHGWIEETQALLQRGVSPNSPALSGVGYPRIVAYLRGELSRADLGPLVIRDTRQFAKRQRTWFRHQSGVTWLAPQDVEKVVRTLWKK